MSKGFKNIPFPKTYKYSSDSDSIPLEFYEEAFPISNSIDLLLGYFSSNAIKVLSRSFAEFNSLPSYLIDLVHFGRKG